MIDKLTSYYGFSRMPFGRDLAPSMLHRHTAHNEAVVRSCPPVKSSPSGWRAP